MEKRNQKKKKVHSISFANLEAMKGNSHLNCNIAKTGDSGLEKDPEKTFRKMQVLIGYASWEGFLIEWR